MKLAIITTHPIQYYAPVFKMLTASQKLDIKVFYTRGQQERTLDRGFGKNISWDIPLLEGYEYTFLENTARAPGTHHFRGIINPELISAVEQWQAEAVLVFGWSYLSHLRAMRYFKGKIPVYFRGDSHLLDEDAGLKRKLRRIFLRWVYSYVDTAFYVGTNNKEYFLKHGLKESQLIYAPHAIDNARFSDPSGKYAAEAMQWREKLGVSSDQKIILFCGKFENKKDPLLLLQMAHAWKDRTDVEFLFVGNGHLQARMKKEATQLKNVSFLDFQNQSRMPVVYRLGDVFVLPSRGPGETWGLAVNEAMTCGRPVVVSDKVGCAPDLVKEGENGFVFEAGNLQALKESIMKLLRMDLKEAGQQSEKLIQAWNFQAIVQSIALKVKQ